ncbi:MAG: hypothetical protein ACREJ2_12480 [Planctomycetota bacterium]
MFAAGLATLAAPSILSAAEQPAAAAAPPAAQAPPAPDLTWAQLQAEEDRIDALPPADQPQALLALRRRLGVQTTPAGQTVLQRLNLQLAFAAACVNLVAADADPAHPAPYADRLALSAQAAQIGATYLKQNDPARALRWVPRSRSFAPTSLWPDDLTNQVHGWYRARLEAALAAKDWPQALNELTAWRTALAPDHAVADGANLYAHARAEDLIAAIASAGPRVVLSRLEVEEKANPGLAAWQDVRDRVAAALDRTFQSSVAARNIPAARSALDTQSSVALEFHLDTRAAPLTANRAQLDRLIHDLQPNPIQREGGQVYAVRFRIEVTEVAGLVSYRHGDTSFTKVNWFPLATGDWRIYNGESNPWWFGFNMTGLQNNSGENFNPASRFESEAFFLIGRRSRQWSGSVGVGGALNMLSFADSTARTYQNSNTLSLVVRANYERIIAEDWTLYGTVEAGGGPGTDVWQIKGGARYYLNHNFSVGVHLFLSGITVAESGSVPGYHVAMEMLGPSMMMQF